MQIRRFLGKIASTLAIGALSASAFAAADEYPSHGPLGSWGHGGEPAWGCAQPSCPSPCLSEPPACGVAYNPPAYLFCNECNPCANNGFMESLRFRADFLWWRACEEGLTLGVEEYTTQFPDGGLFQGARIKKPDFRYDPGFRIGLSTICPCDCYDVALNWTHFHTKARVDGRSEFLDSNGSFSPNSSVPETVFVPQWQRVVNAYPDYSRGKWTLDLDLLDLEFGRKYYVSNCFILRPFMGLRGARLDQTFRVVSRANRYDPYNRAESAFFTSAVKAKNNFLGIGPRLGVGIELKLPCSVTVFGEGAGSLVFGRFDRHTHEDFEDFSSSSSLAYDSFPTNINFKTSSTLDRSSRAITDLAIGLKWDHCCTWCNRSHPITVAVAWEHHAFFDFNNFIFEQNLEGNNEPLFFRELPIGKTERNGDLTTQGLTVKFEVGF